MTIFLPTTFSRRRLLAAGAVVPAGVLASRVRAQPRKKITFAWSQSGYCQAPIPVALERGYFEKNGLDVESLNWAGSADQLLEAMATGKADVGAGLIHRWVKPLESGFDVKVVGSIHGGCLRLVGLKSAGVTGESQLKGKVIGVSDQNSPAKNFFDIHLTERGLGKDVEWRVYPADLLDVAAKKGEIQAIADGDPNLFLIEKRNPGSFVELGNSGTGEYAQKLCCVIGARGELVRNDKGTAAAVVRALAQASDFTAENPRETARIYARYSKVSEDELQALMHSTNFAHHPVGKNLRNEVEFFARDFHTAGILKKSTDPVRFANHVTLDVLA
ncbi:ABC transporter substrate-binding protein [Xylophilus rhododendri]|uniref:ABC transporter substrate-binding protein n=1 Tax=Xylophilus rhododendri TaxID=2697032 RepID=A0A857J1F9_9BURK|nr:ABC transporter substrate-binding protein [Xylophilus rhododendri]QHI96715.1 ABC transporter substrate-binding protein [Xylophilus rhododendri]